MKYAADDCAIISVGCCLPDAPDVKKFWYNVQNNISAIKPISDERWDKKYNYSPYRELNDKTYSYYGAEIAQSTYDHLRDYYYRPEKVVSRLELMALSSVEQALNQIKLPSDRHKMGAILGIMNPDENYYISRFKCHSDEIENLLHEFYDENEFVTIKSMMLHHYDRLFKKVVENIDDVLPTSIIHKLKEKFQFSGRSFLVDAACASGVASIDVAMLLLKNRSLDMVLAGGMESNLGPGTYTLFSKVGALAIERCLPFDKRSDGLSQGEGAVVFCLQRLEDAIRDGHKIYGIVKSVGSSSDGRVASLFQPDHAGQLLAETRAYAGLGSRRVDYLELHGTGTKIGDYTESRSTDTFFKGFKIPVGSVKALFGHTKAAAGATGTLKCLMSIQNQVIPACEYIQESVFPADSDLFLNKKEIKIHPEKETVRFGISSFGFGGTNYHMVLENYLPTNQVAVSDKKQDIEVPVLLGSKKLFFDDYDPMWFTAKDSFYKIPPKSLIHIDRAQLMAVKATEELLINDLKLELNTESKDNVQVISASSLGLDVLNHVVTRITLDTISETIKDEAKNQKTEDQEFFLTLSKNLQTIKEKFDAATEESGPGVLNNVIAGRVCNAFHFRGRNFNLDCDQASVTAAMELISSEIKNGANNLFILIGIDEEIVPSKYVVNRKSVTVYAISSQKFAMKNFLPIRAEITVGAT